jgi:hypothetical protein
MRKLPRRKCRRFGNPNISLAFGVKRPGNAIAAFGRN